MPLNPGPGAFLDKQRVAKGLGANGDHAGLAYHRSDSGSPAMAGNVSLAMAIPADEPLLIETVGMLGNSWEV